jgi:hypothetical protein
VSANLRFLDFFSQDVTFKSMLSFNLPEPVTLKRFLALDLVFILGIFPSVLIYSYLLIFFNN